jgi:hypothetical protein
MVEMSYRRHRFPPVIIQHAVWLYLRFPGGEWRRPGPLPDNSIGSPRPATARMPVRR